MKKYIFRLESVRRVRRTQEELAKSALLIANSDVQHAIRAVEDRVGEYETSNNDGIRLGLAAVDGFMKQRYFNELRGQAVIAARASLAAATAEAEMKKAAWSDAAREVKILDRLDDRRREEYRIEVEREMAKEIDDIVVTRFGRKGA